MSHPAAGAGVVMLAHSTSGTDTAFSYVVAAGLVFLGAYLISVALHPNTNCKQCNGTGKHWGSVFT